MAAEAATAEDEEGDIHEDQKLEPSREGESAGGNGVAVNDDDDDDDDDVPTELVDVVEDEGSGGSAAPGDDLLEADEPVWS